MADLDVTERTTITTSDGVVLEAKVDKADGAKQVIVLCHPHPQWGGTMNSPLMLAVTRVLVSRGHSVIRFNFRGVGQSGGSHEEGRGELNDVEAAVAYAREMEGPTAIGGWSFGARMALTWLAQAKSDMPYAGIAPPPDDLPETLPSGPKRIILGTRDQVIDGQRLEAYARDKGIDLVLTSGDHFFHGRGERIGALVAQGLEG